MTAYYRNFAWKANPCVHPLTSGRFWAAIAILVCLYGGFSRVLQLWTLVLVAVLQVPAILALAVMVRGKRFLNSRPRSVKPTEVPHSILARLGPYLSMDDLSNARLVSKEWRDVLSPQVGSVLIPSNLWQYPAPGRIGSLEHLITSFPYFSQAHLHVELNKPCDAWCVRNTVDLIGASPGLGHIVLKGMTQVHQWRAILSSLQSLAPRLRSLKCEEVSWPNACLLPQLQQLTGLTHLEISSPHLSRLDSGMVNCLASMTKLQDLRLAFRTVEGSAHAPLTFDSLSALTALTSLRVEYTGLKELSSAVGFCLPANLAALSNLERLSISYVPMDQALYALPSLPKLRELLLHQPSPLEPHQLQLLARCTRLHSLSIESVMWQDLLDLGDLSHLRNLQLSLHQRIRGGSVVAGEAGKAVGVLLSTMTFLQGLVFKGQAALTEGLLQELAVSCPRLESLDLCCLLPDGTGALRGLKRLETLRLKPFSWDLWSTEPPMLLFPGQLPPNLTSLEALDVWCCPDSLGSDTVTLSTPRLQRLVLRSLSPCDRPLLLPDWELMQQLEVLEVSHSQLSHEHLYQIAAFRARSLRKHKGVPHEQAEQITSSDLQQQLSCLADIHSCSDGQLMDRCSSTGSSSEGSTSSGSSTRGSDSTSTELVDTSSSQEGRSSGSSSKASRSSILELQLLRRLTLSSKPQQERGLAAWMMAAVQFKHRLLLQMGLLFGGQEVLRLRQVQGSLPSYYSFDMLADMFAEEEDYSWY